MRKKIVILFVTAVLLSLVVPNVNCEVHENRMSSDLNSVLIVEVYYYPYPNENDEYVKIYNQGGDSIDISNWSITDHSPNDNNKTGGGIIVFPSETILKTKSSFYVTENASAFYNSTGFMPDFEYEVNSLPNVSQMFYPDLGFVLSNEGDNVVLKDKNDSVVDAVVYGDSDYIGMGWDSKSAKDVTEGTVLRRNTDEETGLYLDTNTSSDWDSLRTYKIGQSEFSYETFSFNGNVTCFVSPDSSYEAIINETGNAKESICISVYEFTSIHLAEHLINASKRNITVKVFLEGLPAFWNMTNVNKTYYEQNPYPYREAYAEKYIAKILYENGSEIRFMINNNKQGIHDRYKYVHSKFMVIDNNSVIISSENMKQTGIPTDNTYGNRGWGVIIRNNETAKYFSDVFFDDWNPAMKDSVMFTPNDSRYGNPPEWFKFNETIYTGNYEPVFSGITINGSFNVSPVLSPDTSLLETESVIGMINSAESSVYIEQLQCKINWNYYSNVCENLYLNAAINAARRECDVKILLDARYVDSDDNSTDNLDTITYINEIAERENLSLQARLVYLKNLSKIHNKGVIVDGNKTLISSINWGRCAVIENREAGIIIENKDVAEYFTEVFSYDWNAGNEGNEADNENEEVSLYTDGEKGQNLSSWKIMFLVIIIILIISVIRDIYKRRRR